MKNKKAMTMKFIITLVILIISFGVILLFYFLYPWGENIDKESCHQSIILRSSLNYGVDLGKKIIPLKCQTEKICLTASGENCEEYEIPSKDNPVTKVKIKKEEEIYDAIADAMYECHSMLGEGKLGFMPRSTYTQKYCLICSRIAFDEKIEEDFKDDLLFGNLYDHMGKKADSQKRSYLNYLYPGVIGDGGSVSRAIFEHIKKESESEEFKNLNFEDWKIVPDYDGGYAIVAQIVPGKTFWGDLATYGTVALGVGITVVSIATIPFSGGFSIAGLGVAIGLLKLGIVGTAVTSGAVFWYTHDTDAEFSYSPPSIWPYEATSLSGLGCYSFETAP